MDILIFGFKNTTCEKIIYGLEDTADTVLLESSSEKIIQFVESLNFEKYRFVIGMGEYSGRDTNKIRIETLCTDTFRNSKGVSHTLSIPYFFRAIHPFKLAKGIGNSWCNLISYQILQRNQNTRFTFLHIPKSLRSPLVIEGILHQLKELKN